MSNERNSGIADNNASSMHITHNNVMPAVMAGTTAAVFQTVISHPFEYVKTGLQLHRSLPGAEPLQMIHPVKYYFSGCSALNVGVLIKTAARFSTFEWACKALQDPSLPEEPIKGVRLLVAGAITGFVESLCVIPFESIKTTMIENSILVSSQAVGPEKPIKSAVNAGSPVRRTFHNPVLENRESIHRYYEQHPSRNLISAVKEMYMTRGVRAFLQGSMPTITRQLGNSVVRFTVYTWLRQLISPNKAPNELQATGLGIVSSGAVVLLTQPIDVVKTRMQGKHALFLYRNSLECAYRIFVEEGFRHMWKGWVPRLFKVGLSGGISFGVYQYFENLFTHMAKSSAMKP
ncbi:HHL099Cp [Eremothecium sinecaudum]|uniref:HHL099Cp n=1 Tax=Eremothecium sinecaudum TaxID=45286 RepID=A0A0X8HW99_9SACH|nr:HHL099Cp [Eremothecium sinecaudum]AMD22671.1 HHL099Cp [Eremothecium sinecaudum]